MHRKTLLVMVGAFCLAACGSSPTGLTPVDAGNFIDCTHDPRVSQYAPNLTVKSTSGALNFVLLSSNPAPPAAETNVWSMRITNGTGVNQANVVANVLPFMPDMGHGTSITPSMSANSDGTYTVQPLYLFMAGIWSITFTTVPASGPSDSAVFFFCVEG